MKASPVLKDLEANRRLLVYLWNTGAPLYMVKEAVRKSNDLARLLSKCDITTPEELERKEDLRKFYERFQEKLDALESQILRAENLNRGAVDPGQATGRQVGGPVSAPQKGQQWLK